MLHGPANADTTYANVPASKEEFGIWALAPGNAYTIADFACPAGEAVGIWMHAMGSMALNYFQDSNPCRESSLIIALFHVTDIISSDRSLHDRGLS